MSSSPSAVLPFTVLDAAGTPVGMTTFMHVDATHRLNVSSRRAIERIGAHLDGLMRRTTPVA
jgi:hypothetical protein